MRIVEIKAEGSSEYEIGLLLAYFGLDLMNQEGYTDYTGNRLREEAKLDFIVSGPDMGWAKKEWPPKEEPK